MKLSGKCKKDFEDWFIKGHQEKGFESWKDDTVGLFYTQRPFNNLTFPMRYGVYKNFLNNHKIHIVCYPSFMDVAEQSGVRYTWLIESEIDEYQCYDKTALGYLTDIEAMKAVIEKSNNLYNERNN